MKTSKSILILALTTGMLVPIANADLLVTHAKLQTDHAEAQAAALTDPLNESLATMALKSANVLTNFIVTAERKFGGDWFDRWTNSSYEKRDDEAADLYMSGQEFNISTKPSISFSTAKQRELLSYIAAKPEATMQDLQVIRRLPIHSPEIAQRIDDYAVFLHSRGFKGEEYFSFKHIDVLKKPKVGGYGQAFYQYMPLDDWFELATSEAHFSPQTYNAMRNAVVRTIARLVIEKRRANDLPIEGPDFDADMLPVLEAVKAPNFVGLADAVESLGIDLVIPALDFTAQESVAERVADAVTRNSTFISAWDTNVKFASGLGSVMFVMGESAYNEWRAELMQPR